MRIRAGSASICWPSASCASLFQRSLRRFAVSRFQPNRDTLPWPFAPKPSQRPCARASPCPPWIGRWSLENQWRRGWGVERSQASQARAARHAAPSDGLGREAIVRPTRFPMLTATFIAIVSMQPAGAQAPIAGVSISSILPQSSPVGTQVAVTGSGFTSDNTIVFGSGAIVHVPSDDAVTLAFRVPDVLNPLCFFYGCRVSSQLTTPGTYSVSVQNASGTSNVVTFTVR
jgi:hypothetical protein